MCRNIVFFFNTHSSSPMTLGQCRTSSCQLVPAVQWQLETLPKTHSQMTCLTTDSVFNKFACISVFKVSEPNFVHSAVILFTSKCFTCTFLLSFFATLSVVLNSFDCTSCVLFCSHERWTVGNSFRKRGTKLASTTIARHSYSLFLHVRRLVVFLWC